MTSTTLVERSERAAVSSGSKLATLLTLLAYISPQSVDNNPTNDQGIIRILWNPLP